MNISLIIPNWNGKKLLEKNLPQVISAIDYYKNGNKEIIIVDDGSTDDSIGFLKTKYPEIKLIILQKNSGFINAVNNGVKNAGGEVIILLNSDVFPKVDFIDPLIKHFTDQMVFAVGCLEKNSKNGEVELSGKAKGWFEKGLVMHSKADDMEEGETFWVSGGSGAFRKSIWEELGGLDNLYRPFYWEDIDLSYRARKIGYKIYFEPKSIVSHNHETTIGNIYNKKEIEKISIKNQLLFVWKNITDKKLIVEHILYLPYHILSSLLEGRNYFLIGLYKALFQLNEVRQNHKVKYVHQLKDKDIFIK